MEQRNGRIDRTLQPAKEVRCHYFTYPERAEDAVLVKIASKVETIQRELGSLAGVVMERISALLDDRGIDAETGATLDAIEDQEDKVVVVREELERASRDQARLIREIEDAGRILERSKKTMDFRVEHLRDALDVGFELSGLGRLEPVPGDETLLKLPPMSDNWAKTLDSLRPPREKDESLWDWRRNNPPLPVTFEPLERMAEDRAQLHLQHPLVKRVLARFLAQGFSTHDLSRVTVVRSREHAVPQLVAVGRVSLFGAGASRLHDELVVVSAPWSQADGAGEPNKTAQGERQVLHELEELLRKNASVKAVPEGARERMRAFAQRDFDRLWPHIHDEADAVAHRAEQQLKARGTTEADALREILESQRQQIEKELGNRGQIPLDLRDGRKDELRQFQDELAYMTDRLTHIERELVVEPAQIEALYKVSKQRLSPVGLAYIWPEGMG
jgi:hypothetical protein